MVVEALGVVSNDLQQCLDRLSVNVRVDELQKWALIETASILRSVLRI